MKEHMSPAALSALSKGDMGNFIAAATPGGIEAQEKAGQIEQSFMETLPIDGTSGEDRKKLETMGFIFGENDDDIFIHAKFPKGWRKQPTEHSMWSYLLDDKGRRRAAIFYKTAFYDRLAHIRLEPRFSYTCYVEAGGDLCATEISDSGQPIRKIGMRDKNDDDARVKHREEAEAWLKENYPNWQNPLAYWD